MYERERNKQATARGITLVEIMVTVTIFAIVSLGMGSMMGTGYTSARTMDEEATVTAVAHTLMGRLTSIHFGTTSDELPSEDQVQEFFDEDTDLGSISFAQVYLAADETGYIGFSIAGLGGYGRLVIEQDINGDGDMDDLYEDQDDLYRIDIYYNNRLILRTHRSASFVEDD